MSFREPVEVAETIFGCARDQPAMQNCAAEPYIFSHSQGRKPSRAAWHTFYNPLFEVCQLCSRQTKVYELHGSKYRFSEQLQDILNEPYHNVAYNTGHYQ